MGLRRDKIPLLSLFCPFLVRILSLIINIRTPKESSQIGVGFMPGGDRFSRDLLCELKYKWLLIVPLVLQGLIITEM